MKRVTLMIAALAALALPSFVLASSWSIDSDLYSVHIKESHMAIAEVNASFPDVQETTILHEEDIKSSTLDITQDDEFVILGPSEDA